MPDPDLFDLADRWTHHRDDGARGTLERRLENLGAADLMRVARAAGNLTRLANVADTSAIAAAIVAMGEPAVTR